MIKYDGDTISVRPVFTKEANAECEQRIKSNAYILSIEGKMLRELTKDFVLCGYTLTKVDAPLKDVNKTPPKYVI